MESSVDQIRSVRIKIVSPQGWFHPLDKSYLATPDVARKAIHEMQTLNDETAITLFEVDGDPTVLHELCKFRPEVLTFQVFDVDSRLFLYAQFELNDVVLRWLELQREMGVIVDYPIEYTADGGIRATVVGDFDRLQKMIHALRAEVQVDIEHVGDYRPDVEQLFHSLSPRQQDTLRAAIDCGYYTTPRQATIADIAEAIDLSDGTVAEHLQKVEATILQIIVPD